MLIDHDDKLGRMLVNVCRAHATRADQCMEQIGLFRGQAIMLMILSDHDGLTHSELAEKLQISPAAATKVIKKLESCHYLHRTPDPHDERVSRVYIQEEGRVKSSEVHKAFHQLDQVMFKDFSDEDMDKFRELLTRIRTNIQDTPSNCEQ